MLLAVHAFGGEELSGVVAVEGVVGGVLTKEVWLCEHLVLADRREERPLLLGEQFLAEVLPEGEQLLALPSAARTLRHLPCALDLSLPPPLQRLLLVHRVALALGVGGLVFAHLGKVGRSVYLAAIAPAAADCRQVFAHSAPLALHWSALVGLIAAVDVVAHVVIDYRDIEVVDVVVALPHTQRCPLAVPAMRIRKRNAGRKVFVSPEPAKRGKGQVLAVFAGLCAVGV